ncbi:stalk domain-containing protein [Anaerosolibacter sp.]|uniref:stalk domain-containing protein n=1 Tax=Anaerosolibacter sp. TaxID=1872527 RepID=UPI0039EFBCBA
MKKLILMCLMTLFIHVTPVSAQDSQTVSILLDGAPLYMEVPPVMIDSRTMVPVRAIFEGLGAVVDWDPATETVMGRRGATIVKLILGSRDAYIDDQLVQLDVPASNVNNRTLVPTRFIAESLGAQVSWDEPSRTVIIQSAPQDAKKSMTRLSFLKTLVSMIYDDLSRSMIDLSAPTVVLDLAKQHGILVDSTDNIHQEITKKEAELMFIRAVGYNPTGLQLRQMNTSNQTPEEKLVFEMYQKISTPLENLHGFYATKSYDQLSLIPAFDSLSFGWSQIVFDDNGSASLKTDAPGGLAVPTGFIEPITKAKDHLIPTYLMVFASQSIKDSEGKGLVELILLNDEVKTKIIGEIVQQISKTTKDELTIAFDGVVIDFEEIKNPALAAPFNQFLQALKIELNKVDKELYVTVQPKKYYKGYDYKTIGEIADKVILMAHDYHPRQIEAVSTINPLDNFSSIHSPLAPIENKYNKDFDVYTALQEITDNETGVSDKSKVILQLSFNAMQWRKVETGGNIRIETANPTYSALRNRFMTESQNGTLNMFYDKQYESPYFTYLDTENNIQNIIWYEDSRSILAKINLAKLFGIKDISIWRLGNIPSYDGSEEQFMYLDTWQKILNAREAR